MTRDSKPQAIVYCQGAFNTPNGKTAHGLVRFTNRYQILGVIDSQYAGQDAGQVLDGRRKNIPVWKDLGQALKISTEHNQKPTHFIIGLAPDGGKLSDEARKVLMQAIDKGMNIDSGLHDFLSEDAVIVKLANKNNIILRDIRKPPDRKDLHFFSGKIEQVDSFKVAVLGTDLAAG